eukprot:5701768-Pyramimonas_sp.AAC.1
MSSIYKNLGFHPPASVGAGQAANGREMRHAEGSERLNLASIATWCSSFEFQTRRVSRYIGLYASDVSQTRGFHSPRYRVYGSISGILVLKMVSPVRVLGDKQLGFDPDGPVLHKICTIASVGVR